MKSLDKKGFTLIELLLTFAILAFCLCGILLTYINMFILSDLARDLTIVNNLVQLKMEEVKNGYYGPSPLAFDENLIFDGQAGYNSAKKKGTIIRETVANFGGYTNLEKVKIYVCFKTRAASSLSRIIGNDINNCTSSPVEVVNLIAK